MFQAVCQALPHVLFHFPSDPFYRDVSRLRKRRLRCSQDQAAVEEEGEAGVGETS